MEGKEGQVKAGSEGDESMTDGRLRVRTRALNPDNIFQQTVFQT